MYCTFGKILVGMSPVEIVLCPSVFKDTHLFDFVQTSIIPLEIDCRCFAPSWQTGMVFSITDFHHHLSFLSFGVSDCSAPREPPHRAGSISAVSSRNLCGCVRLLQVRLEPARRKQTCCGLDGRKRLIVSRLCHWPS